MSPLNMEVFVQVWMNYFKLIDQLLLFILSNFYLASVNTLWIICNTFFPKHFKVFISPWSLLIVCFSYHPLSNWEIFLLYWVAKNYYHEWMLNFVQFLLWTYWDDYFFIFIVILYLTVFDFSTVDSILVPGINPFLI